MRKSIEYFGHNKYRMFMFLMLAGATIFSILILRVRLELSGSGNYLFLVWNLFLAWISFTGLMLGMTSLFMMQEIIRREFGRWIGWGFVFTVAILSSAGVYVGRFLRWNSWDIFFNPAGMAKYTLQSAQDPSLQSIGFTSLFGAFFLFLYITLYTFAHLLLERQKDESI